MSIAHAIANEAEAAAALMSNLRDVIADDEATKLDLIEGQTSLMEVLDEAAQRILDLDAKTEALTSTIRTLEARKRRFERQDELIRAAIVSALEHAELIRVEIASATITRKPVPPKVVVTAEADIPARFKKQPDPVIDKRSLLAALKDGETIAGAELSNGGTTVQFKFG